MKPTVCLFSVSLKTGVFGNVQYIPHNSYQSFLTAEVSPKLKIWVEIAVLAFRFLAVFNPSPSLYPRTILARTGARSCSLVASSASLQPSSLFTFCLIEANSSCSFSPAWRRRQFLYIGHINTSDRFLKHYSKLWVTGVMIHYCCSFWSYAQVSESYNGAELGCNRNRCGSQATSLGQGAMSVLCAFGIRAEGFGFMLELLDLRPVIIINQILLGRAPYTPSPTGGLPTAAIAERGTDKDSRGGCGEKKHFPPGHQISPGGI